MPGFDCLVLGLRSIDTHLNQHMLKSDREDWQRGVRSDVLLCDAITLLLRRHLDGDMVDEKATADIDDVCKEKERNNLL